MTSTAAPVSAATEQEQQHNDNQEQFHTTSPLMARHCLPRTWALNGVFKVLFPISATLEEEVSARRGAAPGYRRLPDHSNRAVSVIFRFAGQYCSVWQICSRFQDAGNHRHIDLLDL
jgi:hypothetical protein